MPELNPSPLRIVIVDDEAPARARLRELLVDVGAEVPNAVVAEAANGVEALEAIARAPVDLALIDIRMPKMDGVELARHLLRLERPPAIVFCTAYDAYAVQAFDLNAVDYLLKPVRAARLAAALRKARQSVPPAQEALAQMLPGGRRHLSCHERGRILLIPVADILYLKADLKYVAARTRAREYLLDESLTQLEHEFSDRFIRLHRSVLAAKGALAGFERGHREGDEVADESGEQWQAILADVPERLPISRRQWPLVKALLQPGGR